MRFELLGYQRTASTTVANWLKLGRNLWAANRMPSAFALSAITGAGKTVIAAAVVEGVFFGSADLEIEAVPNTAFLWITDDPALNRQTRGKMLAASEKLSPKNLHEIDEGFFDAELAPNRVYFLNTQKLSKTSRLVQSGTNLRQISFWDILKNTIDGGRVNLCLILDEAHKGMKRSPDRATIVQRLIHGELGSNPPMPIVWGISATIERFTTAMGQTTNRTVYPHVVVDIEQVKLSGLVKDSIGLDQPDEQGTFSTTLLRDAVKATKDFEKRWADYAAAENEPLVVPAIVIQVPDKSDEAKITDLVHVIESEWAGLGPRAIAHVFGEHEPIVLGSRTIDWVQPESIQADNEIRVILAKEAISTGWDCPRAEVMYSERPAKDSTHIAQVMGRMVRQPLARRIETDDALNSVTCYLPLFDRKAVTSIKQELEGKGEESADIKLGAEVLRAPKVFERNHTLPNDIFSFIESIPSVPPPDITASPLRRAKMLARLLTDTAKGGALLPDADEFLTKALHSRLDGLAAEFADAVQANVKDLKTVEVKTTKVTVTGQDSGNPTIRKLDTHTKDIDRDSRRIINAVKEGLGKTYYAYRVEKEGEGANKVEIRIAVAALFKVEGVLTELDAAATKWVQKHLQQFSVEIKNTTGAIRDAYRKVQEQTSAPEALTIELRANEKAATKNAEGYEVPTFTGHIFADDKGKFPAILNDWETTVVTTEIERKSFVAWYRNPQRPSANSLRIPYKDDGGRWGAVQVDFLIVSKRDDGTYGASIVDPHGDHLADSRAKLRGLADFAEQHGHRFLRIQSVAKVDGGSLRLLDLLNPRVRKAVREFEGGKVSSLYESDYSEAFQ